MSDFATSRAMHYWRHWRELVGRHPLLSAAVAITLALLLSPIIGGEPQSPESTAAVEAAEAHPSSLLEPLHPGRAQREKTLVVADLLGRYHYSSRNIDERMTRDAVENYLERLDRGRLYLLADDVASFREHTPELMRGLSRGDVQPAFDLYNTYRVRVGERIEHALALLEDGTLLDFDGNGAYEQDRRDIEWADDRAALDEVWRQRVTHDALTLHLAGRDNDQILDNLTRRYRNIEKVAREAEEEDVINHYLTAWAAAFDPHSSYFSPQRSEDFDINMSLQLEGIGAQLRHRQDFTEVVGLISGGPAERSGKLSLGDRIIGVAQGKDGEMEDVVGRQLHQVVNLIRGPEGSTVRLKVIPPSGSDTPRLIELVRSTVRLEDQAARSDIQERTAPDGGTERIGVITIPTFYRDFRAAQANDPDFRSTTRDVERLLEELLAEGIHGLVIDLRGNSGGSLREATTLTQLFTGGGPAVQVRNHRGKLEMVGDGNGTPAYAGPLAVLVDRRSASASEIFAAAIQDYGSGIVIGDQTFGKGTVQQMINLDNYAIPGEDQSGRLKLTIAQFYRVNGESTQLVGVTPDIHLPSHLDHDELGERATRNPLPATKIRAVNVPRRHDFADLLPALTLRHEMRTRDDDAFLALQAELELRREARKNSSVPLNKEARQAEAKAYEDERLAVHNLRRLSHGLEPLEKAEDINEDDLPDLLLEVTADIVLDLHLLQRQHEADQLTAEQHADS